MNVIQGPRRASAGIYDAWLAVLRTEDAGFEFTDPPFRNSLPMTLAFAATGTRLTAVLTGPRYVIEPRSTPAQPHRPANPYDMVPVRLQQHPLVASAGLVWSGDLPRQLQQVLFDAADGSPF